MEKKWLAFFVILSIFISINNLAFAQVGLDRYKEILNINPGETVRGTLTVRNPSKAPVFLKTYFEDVKFLPPYDSQKKEFLPLGSTPYSCGKWFVISPERLVVPASGEQEVTYRINVPQEAKGSYYSVLLFQEESKVERQGMGIGVILRVGCTFFLNTKDMIKNGKIENVSTTRDGFKADVVNLGDALLVLRPTFYVMDKSGSMFDKGKTDDLFLPPNEKASFALKLSKKIPSGAYTLFISMDLGRGKTLSKEVSFSKDEAGTLGILKVED